MKTYERHEFTKEMLAPTAEVPDQMAIYREALETTPDVPDEFSALKIAEVERLDRIREREEARPIEPEPAPAGDTDTDTKTLATDRECLEIEAKARTRKVLHWPELIRVINRLRHAERELENLKNQKF